MAIHTADSIAASFVPTAWASRWNDQQVDEQQHRG